MIDKGGGVFLGIGFDFQILRMIYKPLEGSFVTDTLVGLHRHPDYTRIVVQVQIKRTIEGILPCLRCQGATISVIFVLSCNKSIYLIGGVAYEEGLIVISKMDTYKKESHAITIPLLGKEVFFSDHFVQDLSIIDIKAGSYDRNWDTHTCLKVLQGHYETSSKEVQEVIQLEIFLGEPLLDIGFFDEFGFGFLEKLIVMLHIDRSCERHRHFLWEVLKEFFVKGSLPYTMLV